MSLKDTAIQDQVKSYYGKRLKRSEDLQSNVSCSKHCTPLSKSARDAMTLIHPEVTERYFGCGLVVPEGLEGCNVLDLGSGSGRDSYILSKLVGPNGHVTGVDMTDELVRQWKNSNCVICLCPDKKAVFEEAYRVLKEGGEMYFSDMYASETLDEKLKEDSMLWGEGLAGALYWKDLIGLVKECGFSTPYLVTASHIKIHKDELLQKTGVVKYASGTYRFFKLPFDGETRKACVAYRGTVTDHQDELMFDSSHTFQKDKAVEVDGELAMVLKTSRFATHFVIQPTECEAPVNDGIQQYCHLNPFTLADKQGSSTRKCAKT
ncbi:hypothetical protein scyTo_0007642 [Scyliorhinus torazame]|uniref:Arsenite methyltransferase n=1 Tax=Scyliorhinus torazame TaxID=75743 RepID=A0A401NW51_SCYTO|nr:hypothetical protein [Scyliorhinus torazame]